MRNKVAKAYAMTDVKPIFVSLVDKAANQRQFLLTKSQDGSAIFQTYGRILKADSEAHYVTGIVYEPMEEDTQGNYVGMISRRNLLGAGKKKLILVDHNERGQAVNGVETAEILEIIDHHRLGAIQTVSPVFFRNQPLGSTATIIYHMYQENQAEIDKNTAALLCSAIISDTLIFKSPTCTSDDVAACMQLAKKAELDIETYGREMFRAGSNLSGKSAKEIFYQDYKKFSVNNVAIGVGQINSMSAEELEKVKPRLAEFIQGVVQDNSAGIVYFLLTDIVSESSEVLCAGNNANAVIYQAFGVEVKDACVKLQGVVSRKKQFFPAIVEALQQ